MDYKPEEAIRLVAQDLRMARRRLRITSHQAAKRAGLSAESYRELEKGLVPKNPYILHKLVSVCRRLGMESVRLTYLDEFDQYMNLDLSSEMLNGRFIPFLDTLKADVGELEDIECFLSPDTVLNFLERVGFGATLASRKRADKQMVELLSGAILTMCLDPDENCYVKPVKDDPPDVELLVVDPENFDFRVDRLEITQHGKYSESLFELIGKKLEKRYQKGTTLVVIVEKKESFVVAELDDLIRRNNPHGQHLVIIRGTGRPGKFLAVPWDEVSPLSPGKAECLEIEVDQKERSTGFRGYQGVFYKASARWRMPRMPLFVKEVELSR